MNKLKKSLSVLLTLVMLFTTLCFFVIPEAGIEANAAATTYKWRVTVYMTKGSKNTDSGNVTIYWKTNNGTGSEGSAQIYSGSGSGAIWQEDGQTTTFVSDSSLSGTVKSGVVPANAYPYKATATIDLGSAFSSKIQWAVKLEVLDAQGNVLTDTDFGAREDHTIGWSDGDTYTANDTVATSYFPVVKTITTTPESVSVGANGTGSATLALSAVDQYGVAWVNGPKSVANGTVTAGSISGSNVNVTVNDAAGDYAANIKATYTGANGDATVTTSGTTAKVTRTMLFDNYFDYDAWRRAGISAAYSTVSNVTANGFTLTSNSGIGLGDAYTLFNYTQKLAPGNYTLMLDVNSTAGDYRVGIADYAEGKSGWDFTNVAVPKFAASEAHPTVNFTVTEAAPYISVRVDSPAEGALTVSNFRIIKQGYPLNEITLSSTKKAVSYGDKFKAYNGTLPIPTRIGYDFTGWYWQGNLCYDANGNWVLAGEDEYAVKTYSDALGYVVTFDSGWEFATYDINFDYDGGTGTTTPSQYNINSTSVTIPYAGTKAGYVFAGWVVSSAEGNWNVGSTITSANVALNKNYGDVTLKAQWTPANYTVNYALGGGTMSESSSLGYKITDSFTLPAPTRIGNEFVGWKPSGAGNWGTEILPAGTVISGKYGDVTLTAQWVKTKHTVIWKNYNGDVLETDTNVEYGSMPFYNGATPTKPADAQYTYRFDAWTPEIDVVTGDVIYTATFEEIVNKYTVTWLKEDGTVFEQFNNIDYGADVPVPSTTPTKPMDAGNVYYFDKWVGYTGEGMKVNGNMSFTASYTSEVRTYTVTWVNYNGDILENDDSVPYNEMPEYNGNTPVKEGNAEFTYTFSTWSPELSAITRDTTYTAQFTETRNNYTVTFRYLTAIGAEETTVEMSVPYGTDFNTLTANLEGFGSYLFNDTLHQRFVRWENRTQTITGTATFIAVYEDATAHSCTETNTTTCENDGVKTTTCFCGYVVTEDIKAYNHTLADGTSAWQLAPGSPVPTCHVAVVCEYQCSICKETVFTEVAASGHDFTEIEAEEPACGVAGNMAYKFCNNCSLYFAADAGLYDVNSFDDNTFFILDALQHEYESEITTDPTCTTAGVRTYTCKHDATHTYTEPVNATGHTFVNHVAAKPVECMVNGAVAHKQCSACKKFFADAEGAYSENGFDTNDSFILKAPGHTPGDAVVENASEDATCEKPGSYDLVVYCTVCREELDRDKVITELPHNKSEIVVPGLEGQLVTAATCTDYAVYKKVCSMCRKAMSDETFSYVDGGKNPANHSSEETYLVNKTIVTCYADGYTGDEYHSCCNVLIARGTVISKNTVDHTKAEPVDIVTKPATCYETGLYDTVTYCSVCSANGFETEISRVSGNTIKKIPHTPAQAVSENVKPATCYKEGSYEEVVYCSVAECREQISRTTKTIEKTEHSPAEAVRDDKVAPTCYSKGSYDMVVYCSVAECHHEISRTSYDIETTAHTPATAVREDKTAPTCYSEGSYDMVVYCSVAECHREISRTPYSIGKLAHTPAQAVTEVKVAATCYREGSYDLVVYCSVAECQHEISREEKVSAKLAHTPAEPVKENIVEPTETADGSYEEVIYCSVAECKHEISRTTKATKLERLINFVLKDKVITITAYNGDTVTAPEVEEYVSAEGFIHVFKSWDKEIVTVNGSATYIAIYTEPCDYTELDRLEVTLNAILEGFYAVEEGILEENWAEINAVLGAIDSINEGRNTRDESEQVAVDLVVDRAEALINTVCPDAGSALEIRGTGSYKAGTILELKVFKMPADTEVSDVIWTTSDSNIVFVVNGILYAVAPGTVTITAVKGNLKAELTIEITLGGGARVIMFDSLIYGANYVVEGSRVLEETTNIFWSPYAPIQFRVIATGVLKEYVVYINDEIAVPDENGTYTIPANTGDAHVRLEGRVPDITDDSDNAEKVSIWELIRRFFQKIADFFKNLFS